MARIIVMADATLLQEGIRGTILYAEQVTPEHLDDLHSSEQILERQELTGREVLAFLSQAHVEPDITMEIFFVDGPLEGFGAVEVIAPD